MESTGYAVGDYLRDRLVETGADRVFGVPGDYTLALLDYLIARPGLTWTGCANELNAGYAADGYARMRGIGALCTTFGVGELSAINAIAGVYTGALSAPAARRTVEGASVLIIAGVQFTDLNSGFFSQQIDRQRTIEIGASAVSVGAALYSQVPLRTALQVLTSLVEELATARGAAASSPSSAGEALPDAPSPGAPLSQQSLWDRVARYLRPGDIVLADLGTSFFGAAAHRLPRDVTFIGQPLWAAIGYALPALLGACLASPGRRGILLIGDGAAQVTAQELSTILHAGLSAVVIVVDNDGYTIERVIHGPEQPYNDIARWDWTAAPALFGSSRARVARRVTTAGELDEALEAADSLGELALIQAVVPRMDVPALLASLAHTASSANAVRAD